MQLLQFILLQFWSLFGRSSVHVSRKENLSVDYRPVDAWSWHVVCYRGGFGRLQCWWCGCGEPRPVGPRRVVFCQATGHIWICLVHQLSRWGKILSKSNIIILFASPNEIWGNRSILFEMASPKFTTMQEIKWASSQPNPRTELLFILTVVSFAIPVLHFLRNILPEMVAVDMHNLLIS